MNRMYHLMGVLVVAAAFAYALETATAQTDTGQVKLTEKQVEAYVAVHKKIVAARDELEKMAKAQGFASLGEYDEIGGTIMLVFGGLDPKTKAFTEPPGQIKKQMEEVKADKSMSEADKKAALEDLGEALKAAKPIEHRTNIELVKKHFDKILATTK